MAMLRELTTARILAPLLFTLFISLGSCYNEFPDEFPTKYTWEPYLAIPIGSANFGLPIPYGFHDSLTDTLKEYLPEIKLRYWEMPSIPMSGNVNFDFEEVLGKREELDMVVLRFNFYNGFPINITMRSYLLNAAGEVIDTLFVPEVVMERGIAAGGKTSSAGHTQRDVIFDADRLDILLNTRNINFNTDMNQVEFFEKYIFTVQIGAILGIVSEL